MPEGPSIVMLKELVAPFEGKKIVAALGNAKIDFGKLTGKKIAAIKSFGKHFLLSTPDITVRIHFLLFGSYSVNEQTKPARSLRLQLQFKKGVLYFYTCFVKLIEDDLVKVYDWRADVMNDKWNARKAIQKLKLVPDTLICDALLDQNIFAGVGNIIKNEVLYRTGIHPETTVGSIPALKLSALLKQTRLYSFDFLKWKKANELKQHLLAHTKKICNRCHIPLINKATGKTKRRSFFCSNCQVKYQ